MAVVCEPTAEAATLPAVVPVTPGLLWFSVTLEGKTAHSGLRGLTIHPTLEGESVGVNAIDKFWIVYAALRTLEDRWAAEQRHTLFANGAFGILPGVVRGNPTGIEVPFFLADSLTAEYCVYHHPDRAPESVIAEIESCVSTACAQDSWLSRHPPVFDWKLTWPPYSARSDGEHIAAMLSAHTATPGANSSSTGPKGFFGVCDITWLRAHGIDGVIYGPGVASTAHAENEYVELGQLAQAAQAYACLAMAWCGVDHAAPSKRDR